MNTETTFTLPKLEISVSPTVDPMDLPQIVTAEEAHKCFLDNWDMSKIYLQQEFKVLFLNRNNRVLAIDTIGIGGLTSVTVDVRLIFLRAISLLATGIICGNNRTSGHLIPGDADRRLISRLAEGGKLLDIEVKDHLILSNKGFYSFSDEGDLYSI